MSQFTEQNLPIVAIIGRPNVGKSALFNRIVGRRLAIVHEQSGVTRDRILAPAEFMGRHFAVVDTGGIGFFLDEKNVPVFDELIRGQVQKVLDDAARVILVVDARDGLAPLDQAIAQYLRRCGRQVVVAVNKADNPDQHAAVVAAFQVLGFDKYVAVSCLQGLGISDLLEASVMDLPAALAPSGDAGTSAAVPRLHLTVVGRPNVGKSSLVNRLLGEERMIVSDIAGTTRDAVNTPFVLRHGERALPAVLVDTAGLRRRGHVDSTVEVFSIMRAEKAIERSDLVLLLLDASLPSTSQDRRIARSVVDARKPCILIANKWDLLDPAPKRRDFEAEVRHQMPFMAHAPILTLSTLHQKNLTPLPEVIMRVADALQMKVPTSVLNQFLQDLVMRTPPPVVSSRFVKLFYATMSGTAPPVITMFVNHPDLCPAAYRQFIENRVREAFFPESGLPVTIVMRGREQKDVAERESGRSGAGRNARGPARRSGDDRGPARRSGDDRGPARRSGDDRGPARRSGDERGPARRSGDERGNPRGRRSRGGRSGDQAPARPGDTGAARARRHSGRGRGR